MVGQSCGEEHTVQTVITSILENMMIDTELLSLHPHHSISFEDWLSAVALGIQNDMRFSSGVVL